MPLAEMMIMGLGMSLMARDSAGVSVYFTLGMSMRRPFCFWKMVRASSSYSSGLYSITWVALMAMGLSTIMGTTGSWPLFMSFWK